MTKSVLPLWALTVALVAGATWVTIWNPAGNFWGPVEPPKAQVEAYDVKRLASAQSLDASIYDWSKLNRLIREPQNTFSNLAYLAVGLAILPRARRALTRSFAVACIFLGLGSGIYHASLLPEWRMLDILGVYAVLFGLVAIGVSTCCKSAQYDIPVSALAWLSAFGAGIHRNEVRLWGFKPFDSTYIVVGGVGIGVALVFACSLRIRDRRRRGALLATLAGAATAAFYGGLSDRFQGSWANPEALVQGHAVWHSFGALALLAAYEVFAAAGYDHSLFQGAAGSNVRINAGANCSTQKV